MFQPFALAGGEAFLVVQRIDRQCLAGLGAGDQIIEIAAGISGPDLFDDHRSQLLPTLRKARTSLGREDESNRAAQL